MKIDKATANAQRSDGWWAIEVPEIPGLFTQTRRLGLIDSMVREAARLLGYEIGEVSIQPKLDEQDEECSTNCSRHAPKPSRPKKRRPG